MPQWIFMRSRIDVRKLLARAALAVGGLSSLWTVLAWRSGAFLDEDTVVVPRDSFTADGFSVRKQWVELSSGAVAYLDEGRGPPLILLHGCPFSGFEWRDVLPLLTPHFRVIVPDLRGLGDTPVTLGDDYRLPTDVDMVLDLLDHLGIDRASFVAHDHGGAALQLLIARAPERIDRAVLSNVEAYDAWPSEPELPYLRAIVHPILSPLMFHALQFESVRREVFSIAVFDRETLTTEVLQGWTGPHVDSAARWQRLRRFFRWQLDPEHRQLTIEVVAALRSFDRPVLLLWGARDTNFGPPLAERLARDLPGTRGIDLLEHSSHMPMQEQPRAYATAVLEFLRNDRVSPAAEAALTRARSQP
jgi:pimeloyl-ACP methyl ester carboxylesterase